MRVIWTAIIRLFKGRNEIPKNVLVGTAGKDDIEPGCTECKSRALVMPADFGYVTRGKAFVFIFVIHWGN